MSATPNSGGAKAVSFPLVSPEEPPDDRHDMGHERGTNTQTTLEMLEQAAAGDAAGWERLLDRYHDRLRRMIAVRFDPRSRGDSIRRTCSRRPTSMRSRGCRSISARAPAVLPLDPLPHRASPREDPSGPPRASHARRGTGGVALSGAMPEASSAALAAQLLGKECRPSEVAVLAERQLRLQDALNRMDPLDREVLSLRHFERLTRAEAARVLNLSGAAIAKRYFRALERLRQILALLPGGLEDFR